MWHIRDCRPAVPTKSTFEFSTETRIYQLQTYNEGLPSLQDRLILLNMPTPTPQSVTKSGIKTNSDGRSVIPSSKRADGSTRKEIRVRPGYKPPEDVETYKNRSAESWKNRGTAGVPGAEPVATGATENKSKNAKRREAARRKAQENRVDDGEVELIAGMATHTLDGEGKQNEGCRYSGKPVENPQSTVEEDTEKQKKIRNVLKKLKAVRELKEKKANGETLSHDQIMKVGKEPELVRDLQKLEYEGPELDETGRDSRPDSKVVENGTEAE